ncbi:protein of unknown function (plasmid) [Cupriavidus taiwanensis]|uniref:Uncharacterized protein n=1 Tax=Cupriavidus taiwanensis TaxID=164546 RepID=A0A375IQW0_9BURK|nr:hypothetical protein CT19425_U600047 [Cupriavidus taiwanensis]SPK77073.1 protein of unknown function [Cupriavidus taiwanensis]
MAGGSANIRPYRCHAQSAGAALCNKCEHPMDELKRIPYQPIKDLLPRPATGTSARVIALPQPGPHQWPVADGGAVAAHEHPRVRRAAAATAAAERAAASQTVLITGATGCVNVRRVRPPRPRAGR